MIELRRIGLASTAKIAGIIGFILAIPIGIALLVLGWYLYGPLAGIALLVLIFVALPIVSIIAVDFGIVLYDTVAWLLGGVGIYINRDEIRRIDLSSYFKVALPLNLIYLAIFFAAVFYLSHTDAAFAGSAAYPVLITVAIGALNGIIDPVVYNLLARRIGGVVVVIKRMRIRSMDTLSASKIGGVIVAFNYVFYTLIIFSVSLLGVNTSIAGHGIVTTSAYYVSFILSVIFAFVGGFVAVAIISIIYNRIVDRIGPIELDLKSN